jgi:hypothetical protein
MTNFHLDHPGPPRFRFRPEKAAEAIDFIAREQPGITQYFVGKFLYLADKAHFLDWGRPITFDRYVAMKHGPVPSAVRNMLAAAAGVDAGMDEERLLNAQENARALHEKVRIELDVTAKGGELQRVFSLSRETPYQYLSGSDVETLRAVLGDNQGRSFGWMRTSTHKDDAWRVAWFSKGSRNVADIDIVNWAPEGERDGVREGLREYMEAAVG